jgi:putative MFS transporter
MSVDIIAGATAVRDKSYLRLLLVLLGATTFFEGYDASIAAVFLPDLAKTYNVSTSKIGTAVAIIGLGAFFAVFVTSLGDRIGRRPLLISTTLLYALFTGLTATAQTISMFELYQFFARIFLISEYATALTIAAEEFPPERRGRVIGGLSALGALGLVAVGIAYRFLGGTASGWRLLYVFGLLPLLVVALLRTKLRETKLWAGQKAAPVSSARAKLASLMRGENRRQLIQISAVFFFTNFAVLGATVWWTFYARNERGFTRGRVSTYLITAYLIGVLGYLTAGWLQDKIGRRRTGAIFLIGGLVFGIVLFQATDNAVIFAALALAVFFGLGASPVLNALVSELFPTAKRATAVAFVRSVWGTLGGILGPFTVGLVADPKHNLIGSVGDSVSLLLFLLVPAMLILQLLPETARRDLGSIAAASAIPAPDLFRPDGP